MEHLSTDVLVIGGGAAGATAALRCREQGLDTLVAVKGKLGKSGCSIFAGMLWNSHAGASRRLSRLYHRGEADGAGPSPNGAPSAAVEEMDQQTLDARITRSIGLLAKMTHYLGDQEYMKNSLNYLQTGFFPWLEEKGIYFLRNDDGDLISDQPNRSMVYAPKQGLSGMVVMNMLRKEILRHEMRLMEEVAVTRLLRDGNGRCAGAVALDIVTGTLYRIDARAVILATGHSNYLSLRSTGTREGAANGWLMGYHAGAALQNIEMQWYHASDVAFPASWMRLHMYPNPLAGSAHRGRLVNSEGKVFFDGTWYPDISVPYFLQLKYLAREVKAGRARFDGGYYTDYRHVEPHVLNEYGVHAGHLKEVGQDLTTDLIENAISWHMNAGGIRVDGGTMETGVPGLLAAGSVNALVVGGLGLVMYDGEVAARTAGDYVGSVTHNPNAVAADAAREEQRVRGLVTNGAGDGYLPAQVKKRIRRCVWENLNYVKSAESIERALDALGEIRTEVLPRMRVPHPRGPYAAFDWVDALDAYDMVEACELEARFSLFRTESRGPFYREDYPNTDNVDWLAHTVGRRGDSGALELTKSPAHLPYARPEPELVDFFTTDY